MLRSLRAPRFRVCAWRGGGGGGGGGAGASGGWFPGLAAVGTAGSAGCSVLLGFFFTGSSLRQPGIASCYLGRNYSQGRRIWPQDLSIAANRGGGLRLVKPGTRESAIRRTGRAWGRPPVPR